MHANVYVAAKMSIITAIRHWQHAPVTYPGKMQHCLKC